MNSENSKTSDLHRLEINFVDNYHVLVSYINR